MDLAAQDRWSQGQANLYLGIVAESSAEPQAASSYFRDVACQRPYGDSALLPVALSISRSLIPRACEPRARRAEVTEALVRVVPNASAIASSMVNRDRFSNAGRRRWRLARPRRPRVRSASAWKAGASSPPLRAPTADAAATTWRAVVGSRRISMLACPMWQHRRFGLVSWRWRRDLNPRRVAPHVLSSSAAEWFGPVRSDLSAPEPRLGSPLRTPLTYANETTSETRVGDTRDIPVKALFPQGRKRFELASPGWSRGLGIGGAPHCDFADERSAGMTSRWCPDWRSVTLACVCLWPGWRGRRRRSRPAIGPNALVPQVSRETRPGRHGCGAWSVGCLRPLRR